MAASIGTTLLVRRVRAPVRMFCRHLSKKKWATSFAVTSPTRLALQYFDKHYSAQFGDVWPSVRISLLLEQKYGVLFNKFSSAALVSPKERFVSATDFLQEAQTVMEESPVIMAEMSLTSNLTCYTFPRGDISRFPQARPSALGLLEFYLLDAASVLPVLALNVRPGHRVLDLCAAPGGKTLALLMENCRYLAANDVSDSRCKRLRRVLHSYIPRELQTEDRLRVTSWDATEWPEEAMYDRVLVDAPCSTDRHALKNEENDNIFHPLRTKEFQMLPQVQTQLLLSGLRAVVPGGDVVYSTCTLSALQNESVVKLALDLAASEYNIHAEVQNLNSFRKIFRSTFNFQMDCHLGELVLPNLTANFGPLYLCKIRRLR